MVGGRVGGILHLAQHQFGINLPGNDRHLQVAQAQITQFGDQRALLHEILAANRLGRERRVLPDIERAVHHPGPPQEFIQFILHRDVQGLRLDGERGQRQRLGVLQRLVGGDGDLFAQDLGLLPHAVIKQFAGGVLDLDPQRGHQPADGAGEVRDGTALAPGQFVHGVADIVAGEFGVLRGHRLRVVVPLDEHPQGFALVLEPQSHEFVVLDVGLAIVLHQVRQGDGGDHGGCRLRVLVGQTDRPHDPRLQQFHVVRVDAGVERAGAPQAQRVRPLVIVRARDHHVGEAGQVGADFLDEVVEQPDHVGADQGDLLLPVGKHHRAGHQRVVDLGRLAVVAKAGDVDRRFAVDRRRDVGVGESDRQVGRARGGGEQQQGQYPKHGEAFLEFPITGEGRWFSMPAGSDRPPRRRGSFATPAGSRVRYVP